MNKRLNRFCNSIKCFEFYIYYVKSLKNCIWNPQMYYIYTISPLIFSEETTVLNEIQYLQRLDKMGVRGDTCPLPPGFPKSGKNVTFC